MQIATSRHRGPKVALLVAALSLGAVGCSETDERPATWSYISATIIQPSCATSRCHSRGSAVFGLQLDSLEGGYTQMTGSPAIVGQAPTGQNFVVPGDPASSRLVQMLRGIESERMPPDSPLPEADIELIETWILAGARFN